MDNLVLQTAIGLIFIFATVAGLVSVITEGITRYIGLRSEYLLRGLRTLVDGGGVFKLPLFEAITGKLKKTRAEARQAGARAATVPPAGAQDATSAVPTTPFVTKLMTHPLIDVTADKGIVPSDAGNAALTNKERRRLPSYLSGRSFARALVDLIVPTSGGQTTMDEIASKLETVSGEIPEPLRKALLALTNDAGKDIAAFETNIAHWYDDQMARVSGWYKRHVRWVSLVLGAVLVLAFNLNLLSIARSLYTDQALNGSVVTQATQASQCGTKDPATCLRELRAELDSVRGAGLPIGWTRVAACASSARHCNWAEQRGLWGPPGRSAALQVGDAALLLLGWALMVIALLPGARFWFDLLGKLGSLRATGPKPAVST